MIVCSGKVKMHLTADNILMTLRPRQEEINWFGSCLFLFAKNLSCNFLWFAFSWCWQRQLWRQYIIGWYQVSINLMRNLEYLHLKCFKCFHYKLKCLSDGPVCMELRRTLRQQQSAKSASLISKMSRFPSVTVCCLFETLYSWVNGELVLKNVNCGQQTQSCRMISVFGPITYFHLFCNCRRFWSLIHALQVSSAA